MVQNPREYFKLLNSGIDVRLGQEEYILAWNISRPDVKENIRKTEEGPLVVVQKNLFNKKMGDNKPLTEKDEARFEKKRFGRITFVWLPIAWEPLRSIELTFRRYDYGDGQEEPTPEPPDTPRELIPILSH